jgi:hypothetical protein
MQGRSLIPFIPRMSLHARLSPSLSPSCAPYTCMVYSCCLTIALPGSLAYGTAVERVRYGP